MGAFISKSAVASLCQAHPNKRLQLGSCPGGDREAPQLRLSVMWLSRIPLYYLTAILNGGSHHATRHNTVRH